MPEASDQLDLRSADDTDLPFLFTLYCDVRAQEMDAWGWPTAQREAFLRMQFEAQRRSYLATYPEATQHIICSDGAAIGRRLVARTHEGMHLVDVALLAAHRNRGIGTRLIQELMDECVASDCPLNLWVMQGNPAQRLYVRMGFRETSSDPMYIQMAWAPETGRSA